ncbi:MAG: DUF4384 domain-containing protein, partial [Polaromonas sp.]|nr:DUF4384 domain-containing protein [Polaromonas sp.]
VMRSRGIGNPNDEGLLRPKFAAISEECGRPVNVKTRNLMVEMSNKGALPQDIIHISASRDNEISFDDSLKGGLATQFVRDCMLRDAVDLDKSGAISMDEIKQCAQEKINKRMQNDSNYSAHNLVLSGNTGFVPAWFSQAQIGGSPVMQQLALTVPPLTLPAPAAPPAPFVAAATTAATTATAPGRPPVVIALPSPMTAPLALAVPPRPTPPTPPATPVPPPVAVATLPAKPVPVVPVVPAPPTVSVATVAPVLVSLAKPTTAVALAATLPVAVPVAVAVVAPPPVAPAPLTGEQALRQMFEQRDAKRRVQISLNKTQLKIGQDVLEFSLQSDRAGYVYVALAGSDNKSLYMLFPNDLDQNNKIEAGQVLQLPRPNWRVKAGGPVGTDNLLILVSDGPRDLSQLAASKTGPFVTSLNDADGRAKLGALMSTARTVTSQTCQSNASRKNNPLCSDAYGAAMLTVDEVK